MGQRTDNFIKEGGKTDYPYENSKNENLVIKSLNRKTK